MYKIGICFPESDFLAMNFDSFKEYILLFKKSGLYSFDLFTSLLTDNQKNDDHINELLSFLNENDIKITFHYSGYIPDFSSLNEGNYRLVVKKYIDDLIKVRNKLEANDIYYQTTIVFHALNYTNEYQKCEHENQQIIIFNELCEISKKLNFDILVETLSHNHPFGNHIGDDYSEVIKIINNVSHDNFGICWDMGHTKLNSLEEYDNSCLPAEMLRSVKFTHIHSYSEDDGIHEIVDHLPLINRKHINEEIKCLYNSGYDGIYSIETNTSGLKENINIYLESIKMLIEMLEEEK